MSSAAAPSAAASAGPYAPYAAPAQQERDAPGARVASIDVVRGAVMVLMAIDHVRVYAGVPAGGPTPGVFFTRWVTHFCAPAFVFLAGTAAYLHGRRLADGRPGDRGALSRFLVTRGLWLVLLELTLLRFAWTFNADWAHFTFAGVIWAIGWSMVLMAALVRLPLAAVGAFGVLVVALHDLLGGMLVGLASGGGEPGWLARILYAGGAFPLGGDGGPQLVSLYTLVPGVGVMAAGYAFGAVMARPADQRRRACLRLGAALIAAFLVLRGLDAYGDPRPWHTMTARMPAALAFLNTAKYPASLSFLLMTLGPTILALALLDGARGAVARWLTVFGRVPFFYYALHLPLIHLVAVGISLVRTPGDTGWLFANHPMMPPPVPAGYAWSLWQLYAVTAVVVVALYFPCRWFAALKGRRRDAWLGYL